MTVAEADRLGSGRAYEAARMRWATAADAARLSELWHAAHADEDEDPSDADEAGMRGWLEHGGALVLEDDAGLALCALRWRWSGDGWRVDRIATRPSARGQGFGRWLMTKLEALAIRRNVQSLVLTLPRADLVPYYRRMGYREEGAEDGGTVLVKRVGGTWQRQPERTP